MDDSEVVAAIKAGDPAGLAAAYDTYAAPLYGYCRWMLREPARTPPRPCARPSSSRLRPSWAPEGRQPAARLALRHGAGGVLPPGALRPEPGFDETADETSARPPIRRSRRAEQAEVRRLIRATLAELKPQEHEVIELSVRHSLDEAELAAVLDVSWSRAHALASRAREHLGKTLDALLIARTRRQSCPELGALLADWDGWLTAQTREADRPAHRALRNMRKPQARRAAPGNAIQPATAGRAASRIARAGTAARRRRFGRDGSTPADTVGRGAGC